MTADQVAEMARTLAHYLSLISIVPGVPGSSAIAAGAAALVSLAANAAECELIASGAASLVQVFQAIVGWLQNRHPEAAVALMSVK